jgi:hypothetical protein
VLRITHTRGPRAPTTLELGRLPARVGTAPDCDLAFPAGTAGIAPHHAELQPHGGEIWVVDLGSPGGTWMRGARIDRRPLRVGESVSFGGAQGAEVRVDAVGPAMDEARAPMASDHRVDVETARRLVQAAVLQAAAREDRAAEIVAARVDLASRQATRTNRILGAGVLMAFGAAVVAGVLVWRSQRAAQVLAAEAGIGKTPVAAPSGTVPTQVLNGRAIYDQNKGALYVMGYTLGNRIGGCCTAFAIAPDLLATNAHCVISCGERGGTSIVTQNDSAGKIRFDIIGTSVHPAYKTKSESADSPDVGLLRIRGRAPTTVTLASDAELRSLGPGDDAFVLGFPGRVMDPISPSATFLSGRIGRVTGFAEEATTPDQAVLIQHDAVTRGGNSGSPVFNQHGHVIGVHSAHLDEESEVSVSGEKTKVVGASPFRVAMRVDLLRGVPAPR